MAPGVEIEPHAAAFARARARGTARAEALATAHARASGLPAEAVAHYLVHECVYDVGSRLHPALDAFATRAAALGLADARHAPERVPVPAPSV